MDTLLWVLLDEEFHLAVCFLACSGLLAGMKLHIPKPLVGLCLSAALCFTHRKLTLELPCSARGMPACFLPVSCPGPWQKVRQMVTVPGKSTWLPSRAICRAATGSQVALMSVSPVLGELGTGTVLGTLLQRDCHPSSIVTRLELIKGLVPVGRRLPTGIFFVVRAKEAGKSGTTGDGLGSSTPGTSSQGCPC